jgi:hypothetical protein
VNVTDKGLQIKAEEEGQRRQALVKRRPDNSRRPKVLRRELPSGGTQIQTTLFEELLRHVSCSALIKETKTEQDMRVNQVHFYPERGCIIANARTYASAAFLPGLELDLSIVSADLPLIRSFCAKCTANNVLVGQSLVHLFLADAATGSYVLLSRVASAKPPLSLVSEDDYAVEIQVNRDKLVGALSWARTAIEGTSRLSFLAIRASEDGLGVLNLMAGNQDLAVIPATFKKGRELRSDFHVAIIATVAPSVTGTDVIMRYAHPAIPTLLELTAMEAGQVTARHFVQSMRTRS